MSIRGDEEVETKPAVSTRQAFQQILETSHAAVLRKMNGRLPASAVRARNGKQRIVLYLLTYGLPTNPKQGLNVLQCERASTLFQVFLADLFTAQERQSARRWGIGTLWQL